MRAANPDTIITLPINTTLRTQLLQPSVQEYHLAMPVSRRTGVSRPSVPAQTQPSRPAHTQAAPAQHAPPPAAHHATAPPAMMPPTSSGPGMMGQVNVLSTLSLLSMGTCLLWSSCSTVDSRHMTFDLMHADCCQCCFYCRRLRCCTRSQVNYFSCVAFASCYVLVINYFARGSP
jgi:hypothetical protein